MHSPGRPPSPPAHGCAVLLLDDRGGIQAATSDAQLLSMVQSVETPDERTVTFKLKEPYGAFAQVPFTMKGFTLSKEPVIA